ncbi:MAG: GAF domain-containing protein [Alphaproteobacteria bacterium]|nr:GAF domain-containing protein [Alphaproteobacteria bacterium]MBU1513127.1 GAF domain-containing protein [Alphaproteobacteria bacterium]MBU2095235.1 GAF domain-containing protein [Alphaproteobacteria bacterium]MBU2150606.1 GAF domain-containing protein [Alphaproteobacteria bacterium]MBU2306135.1 GAF domain-containing protein [Alphaproteobacteria bacterium]
MLESASNEEWLSRARFARLSRAVKDLSAARTHDAIIDITRRAARDITGSLGVAIVLRDGDRCHYIAEDSEVPLWTGQKFPLTACISGWAMLNAEQVIIPDIYVDDRIPHAAYRPTGVHSLIMTPVGEPAPFGALGAYWRDVREPTEDEISSMAALASCMSTALQNIDLVGSLRAEADHKQLLINELNHRVKNTMAIVQSLSAQTLRADRPTAAAREDFDSRLMALAGAHVLMTEAEWKSVPLRELIDRTIQPFAQGAGAVRFSLNGPDATMPPKSAVAFALAVHELCTNAAKYGALTVEGGRIAIDWTLADAPDGPRLRLTWRERGGPAVIEPTRRGFGSRLLERGLSAELKGQVKLSFPPEGLVCDIDAPAPVDDPEALFPLPH